MNGQLNGFVVIHKYFLIDWQLVNQKRWLLNVEIEEIIETTIYGNSKKNPIIFSNYWLIQPHYSIY